MPSSGWPHVIAAWTVLLGGAELCCSPNFVGLPWGSTRSGGEVTDGVVTHDADVARSRMAGACW